MARKRLSLDFEGMDEIIKQYEDMGGDLKTATEAALKATHGIVTPKLQAAIEPHRQSGDTEASLGRKPEIEWDGTKAAVPVGFKIRDGGLASIFLMYGTPRMKPDTKLYNAIYGAATLREVSEKQAEVFYKRIMRQGAKK